MSAILTPRRHREADIDSLSHLHSDLIARRTALGLRDEELAAVLNVDLSKYRGRESGALPVGPHLVEELRLMEAFVTAEATLMVEQAPTSGTVVLQTVTDQDTFASVYPRARTRRDGVSYPLAVQHVAAGRAAAELTRLGREVEIHRGTVRADLVARRLAAGLLDRHIPARMFGVNKKSYYSAEDGKKYPGGSVIAEYQAIDDFIVDTAARLEVVSGSAATVVVTMVDQQRFELAYPQARTRRTQSPYPVCVHHVAAARRAGLLDATGQSVRIVMR